MPVLTLKQKQELGKRLKVAREKKKLTLGQVSSKIAQHYLLISRLERGEPTRLSEAAIQKVCDLLEVAYE